jgi:hypothetical protein
MEEKISLNELQARFRAENIEALTTVTVQVEIALTRQQDEQGEPVQELSALLNFPQNGELSAGHAFLEPDNHLGSITLDDIAETFNISKDDKIWTVNVDFE